jgi:hypothetical protein
MGCAQPVWRNAWFFLAAFLMLSWKDRTVDSVRRVIRGMVHLLGHILVLERG